MQSLKGVDLALMALGSPTATDLYSRGSIVADQPRARFGRGGLLNTEMRLRGASSLLSRTL